MLLTNRSAVQSNSLLKIFLKVSGRELDQIGHQQDIGEYGSLFQECLAKSIKAYSDISSVPCDEVLNLWKGSQKGVISWAAHDGNLRSTKTVSEFTEIMVRPSEVTDSFYRVMVTNLTNYVTVNVDGRSVEATQVIWLKNLPTVLFIQENVNY